MDTAAVTSKVIPRRRSFTLSGWTHVAIVAVGTDVIPTQTGVAATRCRTLVADATVRRVILTILCRVARTLTAAPLLPEVVPSRNNGTRLHRTLACVPVKTSVALALPRVGARGSRTGVGRGAVRCVILTTQTICAFSLPTTSGLGQIKPRGGSRTRERGTISTTDMVLLGEISTNCRPRAVGHQAIVFGAAVGNVVRPKDGVRTLRRVTAVAR